MLKISPPWILVIGMFMLIGAFVVNMFLLGTPPEAPHPHAFLTYMLPGCAVLIFSAGMFAMRMFSPRKTFLLCLLLLAICYSLVYFNFIAK